MSKAYQAIAKLQDENKSLKERIRELEEAQRQDEMGFPSISSKARVKTKRGVESLARSVKKKKKAEEEEEEEEEEAVVLERAISISKEVDDVFKDWSDDDDAEEAESCVLGAQDNPCELPSLPSREARPVTEDGADLWGQSNSAAEEDGAADSCTPAVNIEGRSEVFEREEVMGLEENESDYEDEDKANEASATQLRSSPSSSTPSDRTQECLQTQGKLLSSSQLLWLESLAPEVFARELFQYFKRLYSRLSTPSDLTSLLTRASSTSILGLLATFMIKSNYGMQRLLTVWEHFYARLVAEVKKERPHLTLHWLCAGDNLSNPSSKKEKFRFFGLHKFWSFFSFSADRKLRNFM